MKRYLFANKAAGTHGGANPISIEDIRKIYDSEDASVFTATADGFVPAPGDGNLNSFLQSDGTWQTISTTDTTYTNGAGLSLTDTEFSVNFGSTAGTVAQGNDIRINNGQTAYDWGPNVQSDWDVTDTGSDAFIKNKPELNILKVQDVRSMEGTDGSSNYFPAANDATLDKEVTAHFGQFDLDEGWKSALTIRGYGGDYTTWQLIGHSSDFFGAGNEDNLYFRSGRGANWNTPYLMWHSGNFTPENYASSSHDHAGEDITTGTVARERVGVKPIKIIGDGDLTNGKYIALDEDKNYWLQFITSGDATIQIDDSFGAGFELEGSAGLNYTLTVEGIGGCNIQYPDGLTNVIEKCGVFGWKQAGNNYGMLFGSLIPE